MENSPKDHHHPGEESSQPQPEESEGKYICLDFSISSNVMCILHFHAIIVFVLKEFVKFDLDDSVGDKTDEEDEELQWALEASMKA